MTLYLMFVPLCIVVYTGVVHAESAVAGFTAVHAAFGLQFALVATPIAGGAAIAIYGARRVLREHVLSGQIRPARLAAVALAIAVSGVAMAMASTPDIAETTADDPSLDQLSIARAAAARAASDRAAGEGAQLFQELGCSGCHRPDARGIGPVLAGIFGRPVQDPSCGAQVVDEAYIREAILNPTATVAAGFAPVMPTFAGRLTEEELRALVAYLKSLTAPQIQAAGNRAEEE